MEHAEKLYQLICKGCGKDDLTDDDILKIALFLQSHLSQSCDAAELRIRKFVHGDADIS